MQLLRRDTIMTNLHVLVPPTQLVTVDGAIISIGLTIRYNSVNY